MWVKALGVSHVGLQVAYATYPAIIETIDAIAEEIRPRVHGR